MNSDARGATTNGEARGEKARDLAPNPMLISMSIAHERSGKGKVRDDRQESAYLFMGDEIDGGQKGKDDTNKK